MAIQSNKNLGLVGSCLIALGAISSIIVLIQYFTIGSSLNFGLLGISVIISLLGFVGFILFLVAMHGFSKDYAEHRLFNYIIYGLVVSIVLAVVIGVVWFALFMASILTGLSTSSSTAVAMPTQIQSTIVPYYAPLMAALSFVSLVSVLYSYKVFNLLANKSGVNQFKTTAVIFILGGIVNVVVGILLGILGFFEVIGYSTMLLSSLPGGLIQYFAWGVAAHGFSQIPIDQTNILQPSSSPSIQDIYCYSCGTRNPSDSTLCSRCGQTLC